MNHVTELDGYIREAEGLLTTIKPANLTEFQKAVLKTAYELLKDCEVCLRKVVLDYESRIHESDRKRTADLIKAIKEKFDE